MGSCLSISEHQRPHPRRERVLNPGPNEAKAPCRTEAQNPSGLGFPSGWSRARAQSRKSKATREKPSVLSYWTHSWKRLTPGRLLQHHHLEPPDKRRLTTGDGVVGIESTCIASVAGKDAPSSQPIPPRWSAVAIVRSPAGSKPKPHLSTRVSPVGERRRKRRARLVGPSVRDTGLVRPDTTRGARRRESAK